MLSVGRRRRGLQEGVGCSDSFLLWTAVLSVTGELLCVCVFRRAKVCVCVRLGAVTVGVCVALYDHKVCVCVPLHPITVGVCMAL